jgi:hypothetical protein
VESGIGEVQILLQGSDKFLVFYGLVYCAYSDHACFYFSNFLKCEMRKKGMVAEMFCLVFLPILILYYP